MTRLLRAWSMVALACACATVSAAGPAADPLNSPSWSYIRDRYLPGAKIEFDARVQVLIPPSAEDPLAVPVTIRAEGLSGVQEVMVLTDLNPIQKVLSYEPKDAEPTLSFRFKVEQSTPVRAAMRTRDGVWHIGGGWLTAAGGGCTTPSGGSTGLWQTQLGEVRGRLWPREGGGQRLRVRVVHPMDTGLANGIPAFFIEHLTIRDAQGKELATLHPYEPVSENPVFSFDVRTEGAVKIEGRDIQGNRFAAEVAP